MKTVEMGTTAGLGYRATGDAGRPALLFLHGLSGGARWFDPQLQVYSDRYHAIALDFAGYGLSTAPARGTIDEQARDVMAFVTAASLSDPIIVGHSMGGMALQSYIAQGGKLRAAVLVGTSATFGSRDPAWGEAFVAARLKALDAGGSMADIASNIKPGDGGPSLVGPDPDAAGVALARAVANVVPTATFRTSVRSLVGFDLSSKLEAIDVPTLLISGELDANAPPKGMKKMAAAIKGAQYVEIPRCGHIQNLEAPVAFNAALRQFLDGLA